MMMTMIIMRRNIYMVSWVSVSKHYVKHGSFSHASGIYGHMTLTQWVRCLRFAVYKVTAARGSSVFCEPCATWSLTSQPIINWVREQLAFYWFASSRFAKYPIPAQFCVIYWYQEYSLSRLFVPWNIRSHDGTFVLRTIHSLEHSFPGPFVPWNFRSRDCLFPGTFAPWITGP